MTIAKEIAKIRKRIITFDKKFQHGCEICGVNRRVGMTFHHHWYVDGDVVYLNFPKNLTGRLQYYTLLEEKIRDNPERFAYLCSKHHFALERAILYGDKIWDRIAVFRILARQMR